jgi:hypothetical protein
VTEVDAEAGELACLLLVDHGRVRPHVLALGGRTDRRREGTDDDGSEHRRRCA